MGMFEWGRAQDRWVTGHLVARVVMRKQCAHPTCTTWQIVAGALRFLCTLARRAHKLVGWQLYASLHNVKLFDAATAADADQAAQITGRAHNPD